jgi:hypothetical protein
MRFFTRNVGLTSLVVQSLVLLAAVVVAEGQTFAGTPDRAGNNAEIVSITITPDDVPAGTYPNISGVVRNTSGIKNGFNGSAKFDVTAVVTSPTGSRKSLLWRNVGFQDQQKKSYSFVNNFDISRAGVYTVVYSVYNGDRSHLYASLSKTFDTAVHKPIKVPEEPTPVMETPRPAVQKTTSPAAERSVLGVGAFVNSLNFNAGPTLIFWASNDFALQAAYGIGTFTTYEARAFYRVPMSASIRPYFGAGYIHAERKANIIGVDTTIAGSSFTGFAGAELPLSKNLFAYADVSATPIKLKKDVVNGSTQATATVTYSAATICIGLAWYIF